MCFRGRRTLMVVVPFLALGFACAGCSGKSETPGSPVPASAAAAVVSDAGVQTVSGKGPAAQGSYPAIVVLEAAGGEEPSTQAQTPVMDQVQETFIPSILLVRTGQPVDFFNNDEVLHNVHVRNADTKESAFNVAIPTGQKYTHVFKRDGFYDVGCDIHSSMSAQILASSSPYAVVADPSGAFSIAGVPNGPYKAVAYAGSATIQKDINVAAGMPPLDLTQP